MNKNGDGSCSYSAGTASDDGHFCRETFRFDGGAPGNHTESGGFVCAGGGMAIEYWTCSNEPDPGVSGGECTGMPTGD